MFQVKVELSLEQLRPPGSSSSTPSASLSTNSSNFLRTKAAKQPVQCHLCRKWFHNKELNISEQSAVQVCSLTNCISVHQVIIHGLLHCKFCDQVFSTEEDKKKHDLEKHNIFSCKQCRQNFSCSKYLVKHRAERHRLAACNFCDYNFTSSDFPTHHHKTHRIKENFFQSFTPDIYYEAKHEVFTNTSVKLRLKVCPTGLLLHNEW